MPVTWTSAADFEDVRYELSGDGIAKITIDRPEVRNAFRPQTVVELSRAFELAREDAGVGVVILTGEGTQAFCSGGDQRVRGDHGYESEPGSGQGRFHVTDLHVQIRRLPKPVVAMVAGYAVGGGHVLHVCCDLTIAADNARFGQTGPRVGSFDGGFGASLLAAQIGAEARQGDLVPLPPVRRRKGARDGARQRRRAARSARAGDRLLVPRDARAVPACAATAEGELSCERGRHGRPAAARTRRQPALLRLRRGARRARGVQGQASARLRAVPSPPDEDLAHGGAAADAAGDGAPVLVGTALAIRDGEFDVFAFLCALLGGMLIQVGTNLANDYSDARRGTDTEERIGPVRITAGGLAPPRQVLLATNALRRSRALRRLPVVVAGWALLAVGVVSILAGVALHGRTRPYGYVGLGELFVFIFFGVVAVTGSYYVQIQHLPATAFALSLPVGLLGVVILQSTTSATSTPTAAAASERSPCGSAAIERERCSPCS